MTAALLHELANLFYAEADGITQPYAWPAREPLSAAELCEVERLRVTGMAIRYRANVAEYEAQS
jgi:hypothetical protein